LGAVQANSPVIPREQIRGIAGRDSEKAAQLNTI
jgi:hypothetical protein